MGVVFVPPIFQPAKLCFIAFFFICQGSAGYNISPVPAIFSDTPPVEGIPDPGYQQKPSRSYVLSPEPQPNGFVPSYSPATPLVKRPDITAPSPVTVQQTAPSLSQSIPEVSSPNNAAPPPSIAEGHLPSMPANGPPREAPVAKSPKPDPSVAAAPDSLAPSFHQPNASSEGAPVTIEFGPVASPPRKSEENQPPKSLPPANQNASSNGTPIRTQLGPVASPPNKSKGNQPPESLAPITHQQNGSSNGIPVRAPSGPVASPPRHSEGNQLPADPIAPASIPSVTVPHNSHATSPSPSIDFKNYGTPVTAPLAETPKSLPPVNNNWRKDHFSAAAPSIHKNLRHSGVAPAPFPSSPQSPSNKGHKSPAPLPSLSFNKRNHTRKQTNGPAPTSLPSKSPPLKQQGPAIPPSLPANQIHSASPSHSPGPVASGLHHKFSKLVPDTSPVPAPSPTYASGWTKMPLPHKVPPPSPTEGTKTPVLPPIHTLPPPPPNEDCLAFVCMEPYANTPPGSPCGCVLPMQVGLRLSVALYTFFPLVSDLAQEIASGVFMKQSQVRIMGANAASQQPEKTIVLIDLVPLGEKFDNTTAFLTYHRFWHKDVAINATLFGDYEVLYVRYPGLPASPPAPADIDIIDNGPYPGSGNNGRAIKPLGADIQKVQHKNKLAGGVIAIITLSASAALVLCSVVAWILLFRRRNRDSQPTQTLQMLPPSVTKPTGSTASMMGSGLSSASMSFGSSIAPYAGSAKTFSANDIEKATNNFDNSRILGEGGFGRVYSGILEDNTEVAVKVLKRDDQQGGREFLAEIEMLSRLHHRNLVKLIGICTEERARCLVYELIPNGSVESHLHGVDKESAPLDWDARIKIALGAARGLAYLHEDSSPRVIHRDFKASNILLEHDFTPKVSDFGLARTAMDEENRHISTRVMGTFGYVAPEYAMTGHLLVKSDVYSYGVVLLELLTGRKPVDMSQPPGQENLVAWARPLLTSREGLEMLIDPSLGPDVPFDSVAKVAAIASMCVQPEVSHRPFMGEVVQALKLVCNEAKEVGSRSSSQDFSIDMDAGASAGSGHLEAQFQDQNLVANYDSEPDVERGLSLSEIFSTSAQYARETSGSLRRCSSSGPPRTRHKRLWQRMRRMSGEGVSEGGIVSRLWPGSY